MLKQSNEDFNPDLTHETCDLFIAIFRGAKMWNPEKSGQIIRPLFCAEQQYPLVFPTVRAISEAQNGSNNKENIRLGYFFHLVDKFIL